MIHELADESYVINSLTSHYGSASSTMLGIDVIPRNQPKCAVQYRNTSMVRRLT
jgi:hypothetical protein